jgi:hypothetical protein
MQPIANISRNLGILWALTIFFCAFYLLCTEYISAQKSKGEVLLFPRTKTPKIKAAKKDIEEASPDRVDQDMVFPTRTETHVPANIQEQTAIFHWDGMSYDIKIKKEPRRLLDDVDGWVKPGTLTALMGVSGAGKTTLLDVLASRVTMGVVTGYKYVDGRPCDSGFQRKTGYVQQQDLHLATSTVREALTFSAVLRQPNSTPRKERIAYVDEGSCWSHFILEYPVISRSSIWTIVQISRFPLSSTASGLARCGRLNPTSLFRIKFITLDDFRKTMG